MGNVVQLRDYAPKQREGVPRQSATITILPVVRVERCVPPKPLRRRKAKDASK